MRPVWCFFGGEGGAAVLGLMPSPEPVQIGEHSYVGLLVPSAPVPFGGALLYVLADWVKPADGGVERLSTFRWASPPNINAGARGCPRGVCPEARACQAAKTQGGEDG